MFDVIIYGSDSCRGINIDNANAMFSFDSVDEVNAFIDRVNALYANP